MFCLSLFHLLCLSPSRPPLPSLPLASCLPFVPLSHPFPKQLAQIDLRVEAENLQRFQRNFGGADMAVRFPTPLLPMCAPAVLVETYEDGSEAAVQLSPLGSLAVYLTSLSVLFLSVSVHFSGAGLLFTDFLATNPPTALRKRYQPLSLVSAEDLFSQTSPTGWPRSAARPS
jgi:hypothetical protein